MENNPNKGPYYFTIRYRHAGKDSINKTIEFNSQADLIKAAEFFKLSGFEIVEIHGDGGHFKKDGE